jgi:hypothetical protein
LSCSVSMPKTWAMGCDNLAQKRQGGLFATYLVRFNPHP